MRTGRPRQPNNVVVQLSFGLATGLRLNRSTRPGIYQFLFPVRRGGNSNISQAESRLGRAGLPGLSARAMDGRVHVFLDDIGLTVGLLLIAKFSVIVTFRLTDKLRMSRFEGLSFARDYCATAAFIYNVVAQERDLPLFVTPQTSLRSPPNSFRSSGARTIRRKNWFRSHTRDSPEKL